MFPTESLKASAREPNQPISNRTLAQSYAALPARTRLAISVAVCGFAVVGLLVSDALEEKLPPNAPSVSSEKQ